MENKLAFHYTDYVIYFTYYFTDKLLSKAFLKLIDVYK